MLKVRTLDGVACYSDLSEMIDEASGGHADLEHKLDRLCVVVERAITRMQPSEQAFVLKPLLDAIKLSLEP